MTLIKVAPGANDCPLTDNAIAILQKRYLAPNETIDGLWDRVSDGNPIFRNLLSTLRFLPNSPTLFNAGLNNGCTLSACFVLDVDDEMGPLHTDSSNSIHNTRGKAIGIAKAGGGVGYYFGHIRPKNSPIKSVHRKACGPVAVMRDYHAIRQLITQGGKRDLAQMGVLPVWHEDIDEFIHCKDDNPKALESFNISVSWTDKALGEVNFSIDDLREEDPTSSSTRYSRLWWKQCHSAWRTGDPGMLFFDTMNRANPNLHLGLINATNPCAETGNRNGEPCNLGSLVASRYYSPGNRSINWKLLEEDAWNATLFLDNILDRNVFPHPDITKAALLTRKLGLGVMGWADLLAKLHIHYDSPAALELADKFMSLIKDVSTAASVYLGHVKGPYEGYCPTRTKGVKRRNETNTSIAPTGTIAIIAGCDSWSVEPHFGLDVTRTTNEGIKMKEKYDADKYDGFIPKVSDEISIDAHVRMQAAFQKHTDLGVSKTINLPNNATVKDVSNAYHLMYSLGCKGGTVFRNGCRSEQVLVKNEPTSVYSTNGAPRIVEIDKAAGESWTSVVSMDLATSPKVSPVLKESKAVWTPTVQKAKPFCKPNHRPGHICKFKVGSTSFYLTVGLTDEGMPREIFVNGNFGTTIGGMLDAWCINFSVSLQNGVELSELINHHKYKRFEPCGPTDNRLVPICTSIPDLIVRWLNATYLLQEDVKAETGSESGVYCPECSTEATYQAGCLTCPRPGCGWSRCG